MDNEPSIGALIMRKNEVEAITSVFYKYWQVYSTSVFYKCVLQVNITNVF